MEPPGVTDDAIKPIRIDALEELVTFSRRIEWSNTDAAGRYPYSTCFSLFEAAETAWGR